MAVTWYAIYRESDGALVSQGTVIADPLPDGLATKKYESRPTGAWDAATLDYVEVPARLPVLSNREFLRRFTLAERGAIRASVDPVASDLVFQLGTEPTVNLNHTDVQQGLDYFESIGLIGEGRAQEIINASG